MREIVGQQNCKEKGIAIVYYASVNYYFFASVCTLRYIVCYIHYTQLFQALVCKMLCSKHNMFSLLLREGKRVPFVV